MLQQTFTQLAAAYTPDSALIDQLWKEIRDHYSEEGRYYHTLAHLENILAQLAPFKSNIADWNVILFTLFYHDVIYDASQHDNEEKSAELAAERMDSLGVSEQQIEQCRSQVLATKKHLLNDDPDTNYFTDADLSVLGMSWPDYQSYADGVRKEYAIYPDELYKPGRKQVLEHFLQLERIFKTDAFYERLEAPARQNLRQEIETLH